MIVQIVIESTEEDIIQCLIAGWQKAYDEVLSPEDFRDYPIGTEFDITDIQNMLNGSCLGELASDKDKIKMKVIG